MRQLESGGFEIMRTRGKFTDSRIEREMDLQRMHPFVDIL